MFAQNVLSSHLYGHTLVKAFDLTAHPPVYAGYGRTGRTTRMEPSLTSALHASASLRQPSAWHLIRRGVRRIRSTDQSRR